MARTKSIPIARMGGRAGPGLILGPNMARKSVPVVPDSDCVERAEVRTNPPVRKEAARKIFSSPQRTGLRRLKRIQQKPNQQQSDRANRVHRRIVIKKDVVQKRFATFSIPKRSFQRIVRDITFEFKPDFRFQREALSVLQEVCEDFLVGLFQDAHLCTLHAGRKTLMVKDMDLVKRIKGLDHLVSGH